MAGEGDVSFRSSETGAPTVLSPAWWPPRAWAQNHMLPQRSRLGGQAQLCIGDYVFSFASWEVETHRSNLQSQDWDSWLLVVSRSPVHCARCLSCLLRAPSLAGCLAMTKRMRWGCARLPGLGCGSRVISV